MKGFLLIIPFLVIRFGLLAYRNKKAVQRAAYFTPMYGKEKLAYWIYQTSNAALFVWRCVLSVKIEPY